MLYTKTPTGWRSGVYGSIRTRTGWARGRQLWRKGETNWELVEEPDVTHPGYATLLSRSTDPVNRRIHISLRAAADDDIDRMVAKISDRNFPLYALDNQDMASWSIQPAFARSVNTWTIGVPENNKTYFISVWCVDKADNPSDRNRIEVLMPRVPVPPPGPVVKKQTFNCIDSGSWRMLAPERWESGTIVGHGGPRDLRGLWIYPPAFYTALSRAKKIRRMTITIQRANTNHGHVDGNINLVMHRYRSKPTTRPSPVYMPAHRVGFHAPGQTRTYDVPRAWIDAIHRGEWQGLGLWYRSGETGTGITPITHRQHTQCYGKGTNSGAIHLEWEE